MKIVIYDRDGAYHLLSRGCLGKHLQGVAIRDNHQKGNLRTFSMDRIKSRMVEPSMRALAFVAADFKVDPLRSCQAADPTDCRYCSYAAAMGGQALDLAPHLWHGGTPFFRSDCGVSPLSFCKRCGLG